MKLLEKILMPIDVSIDSTEQINTAIKIANLTDSEISIMSVLPEINLNDNVQGYLVEKTKKALSEIKDILTKEGITVNEPFIKYGKPIDDIIIKTAIKDRIDLILTGSGSTDEKEKLKRGTTAEKLMRQSEKPVWVAKSDKENRLENILCPVDFSEPSKFALNNAILLSKVFNANLTILGVYEIYTNLSSRFKVDTEEENANRLKEMEDKMEDFLKDFDLGGVNEEVIIRGGDAHIEILNAIEEKHHDLLIMGTHGRSGFNRFVMGSVTEKVTREVPCSFITIRTEDILQFKVSNEMKEMELSYKKGNQFFKEKFYEDAIGKYMICLQINSMHIPSMFKLAELFKITGDPLKETYYGDMAKDILNRVWDDEIEKIILEHYMIKN